MDLQRKEHGGGVAKFRLAAGEAKLCYQIAFHSRRVIANYNGCSEHTHTISLGALFRHARAAAKTISRPRRFGETVQTSPPSLILQEVQASAHTFWMGSLMRWDAQCVELETQDDASRGLASFSVS